jgi:hypothetical protein
LSSKLQAAPAVSVESARVPARRVEAARTLDGLRLDAGVAILCCWLVSGAVLDAWAHSHIPTLESFLTPWHAVLYSGFLAVASFTGGALVLNHRRGVPWSEALPAGYRLSLVGLALMAVGGVGDGIWHTLFGIERSIEGTLSPTHVTLMVAVALILSGPLRTAWERVEPDAAGLWSRRWPLVIALTLLLTLLTLVTVYANPIAEPWADTRNYGDTGATLGIAGVLVQTALMMGLVLLAVRRWVLPPGTLAVMFGVDAVAMSALQDQWRLIPAALLAGLVADVLLHRLRPGPARLLSWRLFSFAVPVVYYLGYFLTLWLTSGITWTIHLWGGAIVISGIVGLLIGLLLVPPAGLRPQPE